MNRRGFLQSLGVAMAGAVATLSIDPDQLLWVPGKKTIIDLGARPVALATDAQVIEQATRTLIARTASVPTEFWREQQKIEQGIFGLGDYAQRDIRLDISSAGESGTFHFKGDRLIGKYTDDQYRLLNKEMPGYARWKPSR